MDMQGMMNTSMMVLTKPSKASFESAKSSVNTTNTLLGLVAAGAIAQLLAAIGAGADAGGYVSALVAGAIGGPIGFYIVTAIVWVVAKLFGGKGGLMDQANLVATFVVPLTVVIAILNLIPFAGGLLALVVEIYSLYLLTLALSVVHNYTTVRALLSWLIPGLILFVLAFVLVGAALLAILGASGAVPK